MPLFPLPTEVLPHQPPMLYLDKITQFEPGEGADGIWTPPEADFEGHFPDLQVLPGVKTVEMMAQLGVYVALSEYPDRFPLFSTSKANFISPVVPGDTVRATVNISKLSDEFCKGMGEAMVGGQPVARSVFEFALRPREVVEKIIRNAAERRKSAD